MRTHILYDNHARFRFKRSESGKEKDPFVSFNILLIFSQSFQMRHPRFYPLSDKTFLGHFVISEKNRNVTLFLHFSILRFVKFQNSYMFSCFFFNPQLSVSPFLRLSNNYIHFNSYVHIKSGIYKKDIRLLIVEL